MRQQLLLSAVLLALPLGTIPACSDYRDNETRLSDDRDGPDVTQTETHSEYRKGDGTKYESKREVSRAIRSRGRDI